MCILDHGVKDPVFTERWGGCGMVLTPVLLHHLSLNGQLLVWCESKDSFCPAGEEMSTKRKAEPHSRTVNRPRIMKSGGSRVDSERDSGFSGLNGSRVINRRKKTARPRI